MTQALHELWESALGRLSSKVSPQNYDMWLRPIEFAMPPTWDRVERDGQHHLVADGKRRARGLRVLP